MKQLVFIDDSGDPGFRAGSSQYLVIACAIFISDETAEKVANAIKQFRRERKLNEKYEFKFHSTKKSLVEKLLTIVAKYDFRASAIYIDKSKTKESFYSIDRPKLYNWAMKELLVRLPLKDARIRIDGRSSKEHMRQTSTYLRKELNKDSHRILNIKFEDSVRNDLIQLADLIAGSVNRSLQKDRADAGDCLRIIMNKIDAIIEIMIS